MPTVKLPNGQTARFPDSMHPDEIQKAIESDPQFAPQPGVPKPPTPAGLTGPSSPNYAGGLLRAGNVAKDVGKGLLESGGGTANMLGAPAGWLANKTGLTNETPQQRKQQEQLFQPANPTQAVSAGFGDALQGMFPVEKAVSLLKPVGGAVGEFARPLLNKASEFNQAWNPLPLRSRAVNAMKLIGEEAKDVPVEMTNTKPALAQYKEHVATSGTSSDKLDTFAQRLNSPTKGPVNFPEARLFYKNLNREAEKPNLLRRAFEPSGTADTRRVVGGAASGLRQDTINAAQQVGRGEDLANAMKEYADNAKLRKLGIIGGALAGGEVARRTGLLGKLGSRLVGQ